MADFVVELECRRCRTHHSVKLQNMRTTSSVFCPFCGLRHNITDDQAIKAHRLLESLESEARGQP